MGPGPGGSSPRAPRAPAAWQRPFLNVFRHFRVDEWRRAAKEGDVAVVTDKTLRGAVYRIRGAAAARSYIQLPRAGAQPLGLTGRYLYVLFRPLPASHFAIHLDVSTEDGQVVRVSLSSLFKEFRCTASWLQFPFAFGAAGAGARWTCLQLDLRDTLLLHGRRRYGHLRGVRLCASLLVRNLYTSDLCFDPAVTVAEARRAKLPVTPVPREMAFPVPKGESWHDRYLHIRFPSDRPAGPSEPPRISCSPPEAATLGPVPQPFPRLGGLGKPVQDSASPSPVVQRPSPAAPRRAPSAPGRLPEHSSSCRCSEVSAVSSPEPSASAEAADLHAVPGDGRPCAAASAAEPTAAQDASSGERSLPDPVLRLRGVVGFGGHSTRWALWTRDGAAVVYPCHAVIVVLHVHTMEQRFFLGHTDKVSALALDKEDSLLASAQVQPGAVRLWDFQAGGCLSLLQSPVHSTCSLSFSQSGALLCGVGKDCHGRTVVVAWGTAQVSLGGDVVVLAKAHTDFDIQAFHVAPLDEARMASCGRGSVRLWRLRGGALRSCPVDLGEHHSLDFTDLAFEQAQDSSREPTARTLYVCSRSGHLLEVDLQRLAVRRARRLLPTHMPGGPRSRKQPFGSGPGIALSSVSVSAAACAVGSEDGYLRLWPRDFSSVLLEAEHEGPVSSVRVSPNGLRVLSTTSSGHLGFLDIPAQEYTVLVRSHVASVRGLSTERSRGQLATVSVDHTVRIWDLATLRQLYDFTSSGEAPCTVAFHPAWPTFFCGFCSGAVRAFSLEGPEVLMEHTHHRGAVTGLAVTPDGSLLFSACARGTLTQYSCAVPRCCVLRVAANVVCPDARPSPSTLVVSGDSHLLAFVGPSKHAVTVMDSASLDELLRVDISALDPAGSRLDSAVAVCFGPVPSGHLLVSTSSSKVIVLDATSGRTLRKLCGVHPVACPSLALSEDARFLLMAAGRAVKVWDYTQAGPDCQVYVGHSEPVQAVAFTPDQQQVLSIGDTVFLWDVLAAPPSSPGLLRTPAAREAGMCPALDDESRHAEGPPKTPGSPVLAEEEAGGAGDGAVEATKDSPCPHSQLTGAQSTWTARPDSCTHSTPLCEASRLARVVHEPQSAERLPPPAGSKQLHLKAVVGYSGNGQASVVWRPDTGFFAYTCGRLVVVEDLHSGAQQHWRGHPEDVATLALSHDAQVLASASGRGGTAAACQIRIWDVPAGLCQQLLSSPHSAVRALAFSPDDRLLVTLGDCGDGALALWSTATYELLLSTRLLEPVHAVAFSPWGAGELAGVGPGTVTSWLLRQHGTDVSLQARRDPVPEEVGVEELTSLCYGAVPLLYCGSSCGLVCVWDTHVGRCFLAWEADDSEIGVLLCSGSRLLSGSHAKRLRLWAVGAVPELRRKGSGARSTSVFLEHELTLDGAVVTASFDDSMDMGVVGTTAGTLWYVGWAEGTSTRLVSGHREKVNEVVFSPSGPHCATCSEDGSVRVWSLATMELVIQFQVLNQSCLCLAWSPPSCARAEQQRVVAGYGDGTLRVFRLARTALELKMRPHWAALTAVAFSTDGQTILSGDELGLVAVSRPHAGLTFRVLSDHQGAPISVLQSTSRQCGDVGAEGTDLWLAASGDQRVSVWASDWLRDHCEPVDWLSFPAPAALEAPGRPPPCLAAFCPWDRALLVCVGLGSRKEVMLYSLRQKQVLDKIPLPCSAVSLSLSPAAQLMAIGLTGCALRLVDCASGTSQDFAGHDDSLHLCRFTPSSRMLFTVAYNRILVWEVTELRPRGQDRPLACAEGPVPVGAPSVPCRV
ncbi:WD repeat-containing protein 90 [Lepus europaeus]|uniref:WD repeat-containing protein 90 n=1 Tax=Lepus europaeus TaxID=9983 RepID=UPI002B46BD53|nr:WD repeat-containing protein 90 [Lepus europaeus]